jgi:hypothetical protein
MVAVVLLGLVVAGGGAFVVACLNSEGGNSPSPSQAKAEPKGPGDRVHETNTPSSPSRPTKAEPKGPEDRVYEKPPPSAPPQPLKSELKGVGEPPAQPAVGASAEPAPPRNDAKFLVLSELDKKVETYHKLIKPQPGEWKFAEVPWVPTVWEARKKAAEEGKPLFIWYMAGEPLGQC